MARPSSAGLVAVGCFAFAGFGLAFVVFFAVAGVDLAFVVFFAVAGFGLAFVDFFAVAGFGLAFVVFFAVAGFGLAFVAFVAFVVFVLRTAVIVAPPPGSERPARGPSVQVPGAPGWLMVGPWPFGARSRPPTRPRADEAPSPRHAKHEETTHALDPMASPLRSPTSP
ncbi:hypothetical protein [Paraliomyxa miuraensis]|uniref:hypothetical protein n=1 Tax=Paraliomyxa miuraensis TaxID=376150 RepID=UPI00225B98D1|nr:hypothetical protein [Paraliomyxa miuraensis]MCX4240985.1 hypothetical protein [Paraliomyxa miuraensis]